MNPRAQSLIADLGLQPHPEGGYFRAGVWQAAHPLGEYALLGCYVGPGFDFSDFQMAADDAKMRRIIAQQGEAFAAFL